MQPGLSRAIPLGILGFVIGMLILIVIRSLQSLQPVLDPQLALVLGTFFSAGFFVWGMGAFDPRMNVHAHEPGEDDHHEIVTAEAEHAEEEKPTQILGGYLWLLATLLLIVIVVIGAFALLPGGPSLQTVGRPEGNVADIGTAEIPLDSQTFFGLIDVPTGTSAVSKLAVLLGFVVFMFVSLAAVAGVIGFIMYTLSRGTAEVKAVPATVLGPGVLAENPTAGKRLGFIALFIVLFVVLLLLFYYVLIGLVLPTASFLLPISIVNALIFTIIILRPKAVARVIGRAAGWLARVLRRVPGAIQ